MPSFFAHFSPVRLLSTPFLVAKSLIFTANKACLAVLLFGQVAEGASTDGIFDWYPDRGSCGELLSNLALWERATSGTLKGGGMQTVVEGLDQIVTDLITYPELETMYGIQATRSGQRLLTAQNNKERVEAVKDLAKYVRRLLAIQDLPPPERFNEIMSELDRHLSPSEIEENRMVMRELEAMIRGFEASTAETHWKFVNKFYEFEPVDWTTEVKEKLRDKGQAIPPKVRLALRHWISVHRSLSEDVLHALQVFRLRRDPNYYVRYARALENAGLRATASFLALSQLYPELKDFFKDPVTTTQTYFQMHPGRTRFPIDSVDSGYYLALFVRDFTINPDARMIIPENAREGEIVLLLPRYQLLVSYDENTGTFVRIEMHFLTSEEILKKFF